jgi:hypothetical protein
VLLRRFDLLLFCSGRLLDSDLLPSSDLLLSRLFCSAGSSAAPALPFSPSTRLFRSATLSCLAPLFCSAHSDCSAQTFRPAHTFCSLGSSARLFCSARSSALPDLLQLFCPAPIPVNSCALLSFFAQLSSLAQLNSFARLSSSAELFFPVTPLLFCPVSSAAMICLLLRRFDLLLFCLALPLDSDFPPSSELLLSRLFCSAGSSAALFPSSHTG